MSDFSITDSTTEYFINKATMPCAVLHMYVSTDYPHLIQVYKEQIAKHNKKVISDSHPDSGFDVFIPEEIIIPSNNGFDSTLVDLKIKCRMEYYTSATTKNDCAYTMEPRSSISSTQLMLANSRGIIDSGYRGWIKAPFRCFTQGSYCIIKHTRLLQLLHPTLCPILVRLVTDESELSVDSTSRGSGGFGSTGNVGVIL